MNVAFSRGKSAEERKKWFVNTTDALGYGIDKKSYAVWPGNVSPQQGAYSKEYFDRGSFV
jgi:hypothetical protein